MLERFNTLVAIFVGSQEFAGLRAQLTPEAIVNRVFRQALDRPPTRTELQQGVQYLTTTADIGPGVAALLNSDEYTRTPRTFARHVRLLHRALFGRDPGAQEEAYWVDYLVRHLATLGGRSSEVLEFEARVAQTFR